MAAVLSGAAGFFLGVAAVMAFQLMVRRIAARRGASQRQPDGHTPEAGQSVPLNAAEQVVNHVRDLRVEIDVLSGDDKVLRDLLMEQGRSYLISQRRFFDE